MTHDSMCTHTNHSYIHTYIRITYIHAQGAGARYGLKAGDIIMAVNGQQIKSEPRATADLVQVIKTSGGKVRSRMY